MQKKVFQPPEPRVQIRSNAMIFFNQFNTKGNKNLSGFNTKAYSGKTTDGAKKRIRRTLDLLVQHSPPRWVRNPVTNKRFKHSLSFITLTIPEQDHKPEATEANKNLLAPFIRIIRKKHGLKTYIWKAEFQKNGMLHYHITTPSVIHYQSIKDTWNNLLSSNKLLDTHFTKFPGQFPNSTDIHSVYKKKDIVWYLSKEISKTVQDKSTTGKIWDCSQNIKGRKFFSDIEPSSFTKLIDPKKLIYLENCTIFKTDDPIKYFHNKFAERYNNWRMELIDKGMY